MCLTIFWKKNCFQDYKNEKLKKIEKLGYFQGPKFDQKCKM